MGAWGEGQAAEFLAEQGYIILDRNARTSHGEIDLVALAPNIPSAQGSDQVATENRIVVFIEVKTRRSTRYGFPEDSITERKREHILAAIKAYIQTHPELPGTWRIDVISVQKSRSNELPSFTHFENAFS